MSCKRSGNHMYTCFNTQKLSILPAECIHVFHSVHNKSDGLCNDDVMCFMCFKECIFEYYLDEFHASLRLTERECPQMLLVESNIVTHDLLNV